MNKTRFEIYQEVLRDVSQKNGRYRRNDKTENSGNIRSKKYLRKR